MAQEELQVIHLKNDFYRDGFNKVIFALGLTFIIIALLVAASLYLFLAKPAPVYFGTDEEWRVLKPVPLDQPYLTVAKLLQWSTDAITSAFTYDYTNYTAQQQMNKQYFTDNGWKKYLDILNKYATYTMIARTKTFVNGSAYGAPFIVSQGLLPIKVFAWWVQMPLKLQFSGYSRTYSQTLTFQIFIVRTSTLNNINGVAIDNLVIVPEKSPSTTVSGSIPNV